MRLFRIIIIKDFPGKFFILRVVPRKSAGIVDIIVDVKARLRDVMEIKMTSLSALKISARALTITIGLLKYPLLYSVRVKKLFSIFLENFDNTLALY
jgi:hypothetical protein